MPEKRFTEDEARRIFARVAERQHLVREGEPGLTLDEMQEAARASGLDPALVAAVAAELAGGADENGETPSFLGAPLRVRQSRVIPVEVDDDGWARIVTELRRTFGTPGVPTDLGRQREWTSTAVGHGVPIHVTLTPGEGATTVTMEQTIAQQSRGAEWILPLSMGPAALLAGLLHATAKAGPEIWFLPALVGGLMVVILGALWIMWNNWARKTERRFERAMDRVELAARDAASTPAALAEPAAEPDRQLDLDALADDPGEQVTTRTRARTRT